MKIFRSIEQVEDYYFPIRTAKEREDKFMQNATPEQIGRHWAEQIMQKVRGALW